jgi:hypothetical protein
MNSRKRRARRRRLGILPPYRCLWCRQEFLLWDGPCGCVVPRRGIRVPFRDMTLRYLVGEGHRRGIKVDVSLHKPTGVELLAELAEGQDEDEKSDLWVNGG